MGVGGPSVRFGFLSTARINRLLLDGARLSERVEIVAVASRDAVRAADYAREHEIERAYGSYEALLEDPDVEAVYISLPNSLHVDWSIRALEAGKHVLCEKPLSRHPDEVERAFDVAEAAGRILMEGFMYRHHPQTKMLVELLGTDAIGELRLVRASFSFPLANPDDIRLQPELDGGSLMDVGCYCVSASRLLAGEPESVLGQQLLGSSGVDVRFTGGLRFPGGVLALLDSGFDLPVRSGIEAVGSEGSLNVADPWFCREPGIELRREGGSEWLAIEPADRYQLQLENLAEAIRGTAEPLLGRKDALGQARAIEALYRAADESRVVTPSRSSAAPSNSPAP